MPLVFTTRNFSKFVSFQNSNFQNSFESSSFFRLFIVVCDNLRDTRIFCVLRDEKNKVAWGVNAFAEWCECLIFIIDLTVTTKVTFFFLLRKRYKILLTRFLPIIQMARVCFQWRHDKIGVTLLLLFQYLLSWHT